MTITPRWGIPTVTHTDDMMSPSFRIQQIRAKLHKDEIISSEASNRREFLRPD